MSAPRPITLLIAALGGEGGGVLTDWIVSAAHAQKFPVQSTSIPGVAQRTGATTYYIEITAVADASGRRPVMALTPGFGDIDLMVASELVEAGRAVAAGFVTPDRTLMIASTHRFYAMDEKIQMGDGRVDSARLTAGIGELAQQTLLLDMAELARRSGAMINAVMLGAIAGSGRLPIPADAFEAAIRRDGKAVDSNLRGFRAGLAAVREGATVLRARADGKRPRGEVASLAALEQEIRATMPAAAIDLMLEGVRRLEHYQDLGYARLYVDRLGAIGEADRRAGAGGKLLRETARHLAVRMSFEDVIRVAQAKIDPARFSRIVADMKIAPGEPFRVVEFLKPGIEEFCSILPPRLARAILGWSERRGLTGRVHWGMEIATTSVSGYLRFRLLAALRRYRPKSYRFQQEQLSIESWLNLIGQGAAASTDLALEIAECARLIKGYGDTHRQGSANYRLIEARIIRPALAGEIPARTAVDAIASARTAALLDPEGERLSLTLAGIAEQVAVREAAE
jgi:indolepyruvate ferredoxin oxidoreductase, beta subunit